MIRTNILTLLCTALASTVAGAQSDNDPPLQVPARSLPVPTDVSPEMQKLIAAPRNRDWDRLWETGQEWREAANGRAAKAVQALPALRQRLHVSVKADTMDGVRVFIVTPDVIPPG